MYMQAGTRNNFNFAWPYDIETRRHFSAFNLHTMVHLTEAQAGNLG